MEKQKKVIDASVVFKWFSNEEDSDKALILKDKHISKEIALIIPELLFLEISNALKYKKDNLKKIQKANEDLWNLQFEIKKLDKQIINLAIEIAIKNNFTIYDSLYIALAQIHETELITADKELVKAPNVKLLEEINEN